MISRIPRRLARNRRGATVIEFAIIAPVMMVLIMGMSELAYQAYVEVTLAGAMQKAGRDSTIQGNNTTTTDSGIDQAVMTAVWKIAGGATYTSSRKSYAQFANVAPEYFYDTNGNGVYDAASECFTDINGNKKWDADPGITGQGNASDVTVYSMTVTYNRVFPLNIWLGWGATKTITASTVLKNQPYASQVNPTPTKICPP